MSAAVVRWGRGQAAKQGQDTLATGEGEIAEFGMAKFGAEEFGCRFANTTAKFGTKFAECGARSSTDREGCLLFLWSFGWLLFFLLKASGWLLLSTMEMCMTSAPKMTSRKMASDLQILRQNLAHFYCAKLCNSKFRAFLMSPFPEDQTHCNG